MGADEGSYRRETSPRLSTPTPDPTIATNEALARAIAVEREITNAQLASIAERLRGVDTTTRLLGESLGRIVDDRERVLDRRQELVKQQFRAVDIQLSERDQRLAAAAQFLRDAVDKQEQTTKETISKVERSVDQGLIGLSEKIDDLKDRVGSMESRRAGGRELASDARLNLGAIVAVIAVALTILTIVILVSPRTNTVNPGTVTVQTPTDTPTTTP